MYSNRENYPITKFSAVVVKVGSRPWDCSPPLLSWEWGKKGRGLGTNWRCKILFGTKVKLNVYPWCSYPVTELAAHGFGCHVAVFSEQHQCKQCTVESHSCTPLLCMLALGKTGEGTYAWDRLVIFMWWPLPTDQCQMRARFLHFLWQFDGQKLRKATK